PTPTSRASSHPLSALFPALPPASPAPDGGAVVVVDGAVLAVDVVARVTVVVVGGDDVTLGAGFGAVDEVVVELIGSVATGASCTGTTVPGTFPPSPDTGGVGFVLATASAGDTVRSAPRVRSASVAPPRTAFATNSTATTVHARVRTVALYPPTE